MEVCPYEWSLLSKNGLRILSAISHHISATFVQDSNESLSEKIRFS